MIRFIFVIVYSKNSKGLSIPALNQSIPYTLGNVRPQLAPILVRNSVTLVGDFLRLSFVGISGANEYATSLQESLFGELFPVGNAELLLQTRVQTFLHLRLRQSSLRKVVHVGIGGSLAGLAASGRQFEHSFVGLD